MQYILLLAVIFMVYAGDHIGVFDLLHEFEFLFGIHIS